LQAHQGFGFMGLRTGEFDTMAMTDTMISAFTTLLVTVDPPGLAPLFLGLTQGMTRAQRQQVAIRGSVMGFAILTVFALFGATILGALGISMGAFRIAGGLMLFAIAFEMIFEKRNERKEKTTDDAITKDHIHNLAVFPLAIPLIAGPGAISATVLISGTMDGWIGKLQLVAVIGVVLGLVFVSLYLAERLNRFLGVTGRALLTRLLGVLLAALSVQFVVDGVKSAFIG
jgi:multiple antibiotic resistance protein